MGHARDDTRGASTTFLRVNEQVKFDDLLNLTLIPRTMPRPEPGANVSRGMTAFVIAMNQKALDLGLKNTHYADPSGLSSDTFRRRTTWPVDHLRRLQRQDCQHHAHASYSSVPAGEAASRFAIRTSSFGRVMWMCLGGKTGFIRKAGYCLATLLPASRRRARNCRRRARCALEFRTLLGDAAPVQLVRPEYPQSLLDDHSQEE